MTRIDVSMVYTHLVWSYMFCIYLIMASIGIYSIWTDLREDGGDWESWVTFGLFLAWVVIAYALWEATS